MWLYINELSISLAKTNLVLINKRKCSFIIELLTFCVRYIEVYIGNNFSWKKHNNSFSTKLQIVFLIYKVSRVLDCRKCMYFHCFISTLILVVEHGVYIEQPLLFPITEKITRTHIMNNNI